jgi:tetratricopeptide (TPR) repeat protein
MLMLDSPYDPHALPELFDVLAQDFEGLRPRIATIWTTHPDPEQRAATSRALVAELPARGRDAPRFDTVVFPLRAMTVRDYIQDDYPYTAIALAQSLSETYPSALQFRQLLGDAWQALGPRSEFAPDDFTNRDKRRNLRQRVFKTREERADGLLASDEGRLAYVTNLGYARDTYEQIVVADSSYAPAYRGLGEVLEALGEPREAAKSYLEYLRREPQAPDRSIIVARLAAIRDLLTQGEQ